MGQRLPPITISPNSPTHIAALTEETAPDFPGLSNAFTKSGPSHPERRPAALMSTLSALMPSLAPKI